MPGKPTKRRGKSNAGEAVQRPATPADAEVILRLYELRRENEMRKARNFIMADFWPENVNDVLRIARAYPSPENAWFRQVTTYWDMAAALVLRGALHEELFFDCSGEMYVVFAKLRPYLNELREKLPKSLVHVEKLVMKTAEGRARLERLEKIQRRYVAKRAQMAATAAGNS